MSWPKLQFFQFLQLLSLSVWMALPLSLYHCLEAFWEGSQLRIYIGYKSGNSLIVQPDRRFPECCFPESHTLVLQMPRESNSFLGKHSFYKVKPEDTSSWVKPPKNRSFLCLQKGLDLRDVYK